MTDGRFLLRDVHYPALDGVGQTLDGLSAAIEGHSKIAREGASDMIFPAESEATGKRRDPKIDVGLLALRIGLGLSFILLFVLKQAEGTKIFIFHPGRLWPLVALSIAAFSVVCGLLTELASALSALSWAWAMYIGLQAGEQWFGLPVRAALYAILFTALAITGPGKFSLDYVLRSKTGRKNY